MSASRTKFVDAIVILSYHYHVTYVIYAFHLRSLVNMFINAFMIFILIILMIW